MPIIWRSGDVIFPKQDLYVQYAGYLQEFSDPLNFMTTHICVAGECSGCTCIPGRI